MAALPRIGDRVTIIDADPERHSPHAQQLAGQVVGYATVLMARLPMAPYRHEGCVIAATGAHMIDPTAMVIVALDRGFQSADALLCPTSVDLLTVHPDNIQPAHQEAQR